jgi:hypothetical protein
MLCLLPLLALVPKAVAQDVTWTNGAGGFSWSTGVANWNTGAWNNANVNTAIFNGTAPGTLTVNSAITLRGINFQAGGYEISGSNTLTLSSGWSSGLGIATGEIRVNPGVDGFITAPIGGSVGLT